MGKQAEGAQRRVARPVGNPGLSRARTGAHDGGEMIKLTPGKLAGLNAVSNERGVIAAAAMDQRGSVLM